MGTLSRNTDDANGHIDKIFDKDKIQTDQRVTQLAEQVMQQTASNVLNQLSVNAKDDAAKKLASDAAYQAADAGQRKSMEDAAFLAVDQKYGIGSPYWTAATAISGALAGLTGGDMGQALAGGLAPYLSQEVKKVTGDSAVANTVGHALAGAVTAYIQGGSVTGGAAGGAAGELAAKIIISAFYPNTKPEDLTEDQKANVSALSTLAAGLAGGVAGNSSLAGVQGAIAGKAAVENNALASDPNEIEKKYEIELQRELHQETGAPRALDDRENAIHEIVPPGLGIGVGIGAKGSNGAQSTVNQGKLNSQLLAEEVANGHAYEKHVLERQEFSDLGISTKSQFQSFVEGIVTNPEIERRQSVDGTTYYLDNSTKTIVIRGQRGEATAFRPDKGGVGWDNYINSQVPKK